MEAPDPEQNLALLVDADAETAPLVRAALVETKLELVEAKTVAEAFDALYHLERAARPMVLAYSTGQPLEIMPDALAEITAAEWEDYTDSQFAHFAEMKRVLDIEEPDYKD